MTNRHLAALALALLLASGHAIAEPVDLNTATAEELAEHLTGIGAARARAIVEYRRSHGPFRRIEDLEAVEGIGPHIVELNRDSLTIGKPGKG